jgi:hypothetical protein
MELDELKQALQQQLNKEQEKSEADLFALLKNNPASIVAKIKRSLVFEIVCCIVAIAIFVVVAWQTHYKGLHIYFSSFSVACLLFMFLLLAVKKRIDTLSSSPLPVKQNLAAIHNIITVYSKRCFQFTMALIPVTMGFSFWLGYHEQGGLQPNEEAYFSVLLNNSAKVYVFLGAYFLVLAVTAYFLTKWYLKKLYGRYLQQLQDYLQELEEQ